jgi:hypothetical protein
MLTMSEQAPTSAETTTAPTREWAPATESVRHLLPASDPLGALWTLSKSFASHARRLEVQAATAISRSLNSEPATQECYSSTSGG